MENKSLIERHTLGDGSTKKINAVTALQEVDVRLRTLHLQVQELQEALMGAATLVKELNERVDKIAPKIDIVSMDEARKILTK
jgi:t-SNARE complex subunit (syntaxin)